MADFRKWFLVLAVLALVVVPASAQQGSVTCSANSSNTPTIRDGGLAELVGDVVITCSGGAVGGNDLNTNIQVTMTPGQVTNRLWAGNSRECPIFSACVTDATLLVTRLDGSLVSQTGNALLLGPQLGLLQQNIMTGDVPNTRNAILWPNVTIPQGTTSFIRLSNIRVAAPPASASSVLTAEFAQVSTIPAGSLTISQPNPTVAYVQPALQFAVRTCKDDGVPSLTFQQCIAQPKDSANTIAFNVKFTEGFLGAFKPRGTNQQRTPGVGVGLAGASGNTGTESGYTPLLAESFNAGVILDQSTDGKTAGLADTGTRLLVKFTNIPAGVTIAVTQTETLAGTSNISAAGNSTAATRVEETLNATIKDPTSTTSTTAGAKCNGNSYATYQVPITGGSGSATWEIVQATPLTTSSNVRYISFGVVISYTPNTGSGLPGLTGTTPGGVAGEFAPVSTVDYASTGATIPRFRDNPINAQVFAIVPCVSNLLFPFVTNQGGFNTGIALVNTSLDNAGSKQPFNTSTQKGACTVYYFNGTSTAPAPQVTPEIVAGGMNTFTLQAGGVAGATSSAQGFQGYIIARCNFQYAHGYAYISDMNVPGLGSQGYLALVIPDRSDSSRLPDPFQTAGGGSGEQLTN